MFLDNYLIKLMPGILTTAREQVCDEKLLDYGIEATGTYPSVKGKQIGGH
mgnify:CR=1 FL=1